MKTLVIIPRHFDTIFRMKGLSIKAAGKAGKPLCRDESGYYIDNGFNLNPHTCLIELDYLIKFLKELYTYLPFDKIKIKGNYQISGKELMKRITNNN